MVCSVARAFSVGEEQVQLCRSSGVSVDAFRVDTGVVKIAQYYVAHGVGGNLAYEAYLLCGCGYCRRGVEQDAMGC